jgi:signal transduction histidine kinase
VLDNSQLYAQLNSDLTERVQSEVRLRELQTQVIDERQRMARDLHDSVNQSINSLVLFSETLVSTLDKNNVERARQISERIQESARQALKETRLLLYQTQTPVEGRDVDLVEELNARLANVELRAGIRAQLILEGSLEHCPAAWHENLFWITIEALNNSLKHAQARRVQINIRSFPKYVELEVKDNGRGFDTARPNAGGYGLRTMRERADLLGGELTLTSNPAKGTSVLLRVEIKE